MARCRVWSATGLDAHRGWGIIVFANREHMSNPPAIWEKEEVVAHTECMARSLRHWTGRELVPSVSDRRELPRIAFEAPFVLVSQGIEEDPILNYGNLAALQLWETRWEQLTRMRSRLTAEAPNRDERLRLLERVTREGFIANYAGVRIGRTGRRFGIARATVWNLLTPESVLCGQAAMFGEWTFFD